MSVGSVNDYDGVPDYHSFEMVYPSEVLLSSHEQFAIVLLYTLDAIVVSRYSFSVRYGSLIRDYSSA